MIPSKMENTNWRAMQAPRDPNNKKESVVPHGVLPRYMTMGSWKHTAGKKK
jgi:hypothetical protein